jgi:hypothetical protein
MHRILSWLGVKLRALVGLILPVFGRVRTSQTMGRGLRWFLHLALLTAILIGLYILNTHVLHLDIKVRTQVPFVAQNWLPILFLLVYALCWLSWWLWKLLVSEEEESAFPDIDGAWEEAVATLNRAGLGLSDLPVFLILGQPESDEPSVFKAAQLSLAVRQAPAHPDAPVHVYATRDAIYVTCPGASLLGRYAASLAAKTPAAVAAPTSPGGEGDMDELLKTLRIDKGTKAAQNIGDILARAEREGRSLASLTPEERRELRSISRRDNPHLSLLRNVEEIELHAARLRHLCRLMVRDRHPYCAVNGMLLLIPFAGTDSDQDATDTADVIQRDLAVTRSALKVHCPLFAMLCDLESAPGFSELLQRFGAKERLQRVGQRCPLAPDLKEGAARSGFGGPMADMLDSLARWVSRSVVPGWVYKKFQLEKKAEDDPLAITHANSRLFLLVDEMRERQRRLGLILARGLGGVGNGGPLLFGGLYLAATGNTDATQQAFVAGVFSRLLEGQSTVYWTDQTRAEEATYERWITIGWAAVGCLVLGVVALVWFSVKS